MWPCVSPKCRRVSVFDDSHDVATVELPPNPVELMEHDYTSIQMLDNTETDSEISHPSLFPCTNHSTASKTTTRSTYSTETHPASRKFDIIDVETISIDGRRNGNKKNYYHQKLKILQSADAQKA